jgi:hypothetical protein
MLNACSIVRQEVSQSVTTTSNNSEIQKGSEQIPRKEN